MKALGEEGEEGKSKMPGKVQVGESEGKELAPWPERRWEGWITGCNPSSDLGARTQPP